MILVWQTISYQLIPQQQHRQRRRQLQVVVTTTKNPTSFNFNFCELDSISRFEEILGWEFLTLIGQYYHFRQKSIWLNFADEIGPFDFRNNRVKFNSHMILRGGNRVRRRYNIIPYRPYFYCDTNRWLYYTRLGKNFTLEIFLVRITWLADQPVFEMEFTGIRIQNWRWFLNAEMKPKSKAPITMVWLFKYFVRFKINV